MKTVLAILILCLACSVCSTVRGAASVVPRLPKKHDVFFIENDFVYRRFLALSRDGSYRQINRERAAAAEVDRGTWEQVADGTVLLHFTQGGLRFHALLSGPLSMTLADPQQFAGLPVVADTIRRWLAQSSDDVFAIGNVQELAIAPAVLVVDPQAESFRRADLESLAGQIDNFAWSEQHQTCRLTPTKPAGLPPLLIQRDTVFQASDLQRVQVEYHVLPGRTPPFYFAQVDAATFAREVGSWLPLP